MLQESNKNIQTGNPQIENFGVNFAKSMLSGSYPGDIHQDELRGFALIPPPDREVFGTYFKEDTPQEIIDRNYAIINHNFKLYENKEFNPYVTKGTYSHEGVVYTPGFEPETKWMTPNMEEFTRLTEPSKYITPAGTEIDRQHKMQVAKDNAIWKTLDGRILPLELHNGKDGYLEEVYDEDYKTNIFHEVLKSDYVPSDKIKPSDSWLVGGVPTLSSNSWSTAGRGLLSGGWGQLIKGVAGIAFMANDGYSFFASLDDTRTFDQIASNSDLHKTAIKLLNYSNYQSRINTDEQNSIFDSWNSLLYQSMNGIAQFGPMIGTSMLGGGIGLGLGKIAAKVAVKGAVKGMNSGAMAAFSSKMYGSIVVFGFTKEELERQGYNKKDSWYLAYLLAVGTFASESILTANINERLGWNIANSYLRRIDQQSVAALGKQIVRSDAKKLALINGIEQKISKGTIGYAIGKGEKMSLMKRFGRIRRELFQLGDDASLAKTMVFAGGEESFEEWMEGKFHQVSSMFFNENMMEIARNNIIKYDGIKFTPLDDGFRVEYNNGRTERIELSEKLAIDKTIESYKGILSGEMLMNEDASWDEVVVAAIAASSTGGPLTHMTHIRNRKKKKQFFAMGLEVSKNPSAIKNVDNVVDQWLSEKLITEKEANGYEDKDGNHVNGLRDDIKQSVLLLADQIKSFNIDDPAVMKALGQDVPLMQELYDNMQYEDRLIGAIAALEALEKNATEEEKKAAILDHIDEEVVFEGDKLKVLLKRKEIISNRISKLITVKKGPDGESTMEYEEDGSMRKAETSERYTERMNRVATVDALATAHAKKMADDRTKWVTWFEKKVGGRKFATERRKAFISKQRDKIKNDLTKLTQLRFGDLKTDEPYELLKRIVETFLPNIGESIDNATNRIIAGGKLKEGSIEFLKNVMESSDVLFNEEVEVEVKGEKDAEGKSTTTTKKISLKSLMNEIKTKGAENFMSQLSENPVLALSVSKLNDNMKAIAQFFDKDFLAYRPELKSFYDKAKTLVSDFESLSIATILYEEEGGTKVEFSDLRKQLSDSDTESSVRAMKQLFDEFNIDDVGNFTENLDVKKNQKIGDIDNIAMGEQLRAIFNDPVLRQLLDAGLDNEVGAVITLLAQSDVDGKSFGNVYEELRDIFADEKGRLQDPEATLDNLRLLSDNLNTMLTYVDLMEITNDQLFNKKDKREHAITAPEHNRDKMLSEEHIVELRNIINLLQDQISTWGEDPRLEDITGKNSQFKVRVAHLANRIESLNFIYGHEDLKLSKKDKTRFGNVLQLVDDAIKDRTKIPKEQKSDDAVRVTAQALSPQYFSLDNDKAKEEMEVFIARIEGQLDRLESQLGGKLESVLKSFKKNYKRDTLNLRRHQGSYFNLKTPTIDGYYSLKTFNDGMAFYTRAIANGAKTFEDSLSVEVNEDNAIKSTDFFVQSVLSHLLMIQVFGAKIGGKRMPTKSQILKLYSKTVKEFKGTDRPLETWEQTNQLLELVASYFVEDPSPTANKKYVNFPHSVLLGGYAGTGKTAVSSIALTIMLHKILQKKINVVVIVPNEHLQDAYEKREKEIKKQYGDKSVEFDFVFLDELGPDDKLFKKADIIFAEEVSMYSDVGARSDIALVQEMQDNFGKKLYLIGDDGQVGSVDATKSEDEVFMNNRSVTVLTEIFRTSITSLFLLQEKYRSWSDEKTLFNASTSVFKTYDNSDKAGIQYVDRNSTKKEVVAAFIDARNNGKDAILILPSYDERDAIITENPNLDDFGAYVKVLEHDTDKIRKNTKLRIMNVAGMDAAEVYIPFAPDELISRGPNIGQVYFYNGMVGDDTHLELANRMMLSAVSRAKRFVMMGMANGTSENVTGTDVIIPGYISDQKAPAEDIEGAETPDDMRAKRIRHLKERIGNDVKNYNIKGKDTLDPDDDTTIADEKVDGETDEVIRDRPDDVGPDQPDDSTDIPTKPVDPKSVLTTRDDEVTLVISKMKKAAVKLRKARFIGQAVEVTDEVYEVFGSKTDDNLAQLRGIMLSAALKVVMEGDNIRTTTMRDYNTALNEYFQASKANKTYDPDMYEKARAGLTNHVLQTMAEIAFDENFIDDGMFVSRPELQINKQKGSPFVMKVVGIADDGSPIVDIYVVAAKTRNQSTLEKFDPQRKYKKINRQKLARFAALAIKKGYKVNQLKMIQIIDDKSGAFSQGTSFVMSEKQAGKMIYEANIALFKKSKDASQLLVSMEDLYNTERFVDEGPAFGITVSAGDTFIDQKTLKDSFIKEVKLKYFNGKWDYRYVVEDSDGKIKEYNQSKLQTSFRLGVQKQEVVRHRRNAIAYKKENRLFSSTMIIMAKGKFKPSSKKFWSKKNKWLNNKRKLTRYIISRGIDQLDKVYVNGLQFDRPDINGVITPVTQNHAIVNKMRDEDIGEAAEHLKMTADDFKKAGYHYLSVDGQPELGVPGVDRAGDVITGVIEMQNLAPVMFEEAVTANIITEDLMNDIRESFTSETDADLRDAMVAYQIQKIKLLQQGYKKYRNNTNQNEIVIGQTFIIGDIDMNPVHVAEKAEDRITATKLRNQVEEQGLRFISTTKVPLDPETERVRFNLKFEDEKGAVINILADARRFASREEFHKYIDDAKTELDSKEASFQILIDQYDAITLPDIDDQVAMDKWRKDRKLIMKKLWPIYMEKKAWSLLHHNRSVMSKLLANKTRNVHKRMTIATGTKNLMTFGYTMSDRIRLLKQQLSDLRNIDFFSDEAQNHIYVPIYSLSQIDEKGHYVIDEDNLTTSVLAIMQPQIFTSATISGLDTQAVVADQKSIPVANEDAVDNELSDEGSDSGLFSHEVTSFRKINVITEEKAMEQLIAILGEDIFDRVKINVGIITRNGRYLLGAESHGRIWLASFLGMVEKSTPRHEAMHLIFEYLMDDNLKDRVVAQARKDMVRKGLADTQASITYNDIHEYLAVMYGEELYKGDKGFNKNTFWGSVMQFIRDVINRLTSPFGQNAILELFEKADTGYYAVDINAIDFIGGEVQTNTAENEFNSIDMVNGIDAALAGWETAKDMRDRYIMPNVLLNSKYGKSIRLTEVESGFKGSAPNVFNKAISLTLQNIVDIDDVNQDKKFSYIDKDGVTQKSLSYEDLTLDNYSAAIQGEKVYQTDKRTGKRLRNNEFKKAYFFKIITGGFEYDVVEDNKSRTISFTGETIMLALLQERLPGLDLAEINYDARDGGMVTVSQLNMMINKENINPLNSLSAFIKFMVSQVPFRIVRTDDRGIVSDTIQATRINSRIADKILLDVSAELRSRGLYPTYKNFFDILKEFSESEAPNIYVNTAYSLSVYFGSTYSKKQQDQIDQNKGITTFDGEKHPTSKVYSLDGIGYLNLIGKTKAWLKAHLILTEAQANDIIQKQKAFGNVINALVDHYTSLANTVHIQLISNGRDNVRIARLRSLDRTHTNSRIILATQASMFNQADSFLRKDARDMFYGSVRKYDFRKDGVYMGDEGKGFKKIVGISNGKGVLVSNISKEKQILAIQEYLNDLFPRQSISKPVVVGILGLKRGSKRVNTGIITQLYYMGLMLKKTAIDSHNWYALKDGDKFQHSKESLDLAKVLDIYINQTDGVNEPVQQTATRKEDRRKVEEQIKVYSHLQFQGFIHDFLSEQMAKTDNSSASRALYTVDGERRYAYQQTSTLTDSFPNSGFENPSTDVMRNNILRDIDMAIEAGDIKKLQASPVITYKNGKITHNDPILNHTITFDYIAEYGGERSPWFATPASKMTRKDYFEDLLWLTKLSLKKHRRIIPAFLETQSDRKKISMVNWVSGKLFGVNTNKENQITSININSKEFVKIAQDFVRYAHRRIEVSGKESVKHNSYANVNLTKFNAAMKSGQYKIAMDMITAVFDAEYSDFVKVMGDLKLVDKDARVVMSGKFDESAFIEAVLKFGGQTEFFQEEFDRIHEALDDGTGITSGELISSRGRMLSILKKLRQTNPEYQVKNSDFTNQTFKVINDIFNSLIPKGATKTNENDEVMKVMFWSHNFINNSVNHLVRGDTSKFKDFSDYIKRGVGLDATGSVYNRDIIGRKHNVLLMNDPKRTNKMFDGTVLITDGLRWVNPIVHYLFSVSKGQELGTISFSAQKNVQYNYQPIGDGYDYYKMSDVPVNYSLSNEASYRDILETMFGPELWEEYHTELLSGSKGFRSAITKIADKIQIQLAENDGESDILNQMVSIIAHVETQKGIRENVQDYYSETDKNGVETLRLNPKLNSPETVNIVPTDNLRLQQVAGGFRGGKKRAVLSQQDNIVSAGWWNHEDIAQKISDALMFDVSNKSTQITENMNNPRMMSDDIVSRNRTKGAGHKLFRLATDSSISPEVYQLKATQSQLTEMNEALRPKVPGASVIQTPFIGHVYERNGQVYTHQDLSATQMENYAESGMTKRFLAPLQFMLDGKIIETKEELFKTSGAKMIPQEIIMPFTYREKFGISYGKQPQQLMMTGLPGSRNNWMTVRGKDNLPYKMIREGMEKYLKQDGFKFLNSFDSDVQRYIIKKLIKEGVLVYPTDVDASPLEYFQSDDVDAFANPEIKNAFLSMAANYMRAMNESLDVFAGRIPGTNASSGFPSRIIAFLWDSDNTILYSPEKNILDGSDNDIDELHIIHRALEIGSKKEIETAKNQNKIFTALWTYYKKPQNYPLIMQQVGPERLVELAKKYPPTEVNYEASLPTSGRERITNRSGDALIGHFANLQTVLLRMMQIDPNKRKEMFAGINGVISKTMEGDKRISPLTQDSTDSLMELIDSTSILINAATDNSKLGGILGRLGININTSNLVAGFIAAGFTLEDIAAILDDSEVKEFMFDHENSNFKMYTILDSAVNEDSSKIMKQIREAAIIGEQLRRLTEIIRLQQGIGTDLFSLYKLKSDFQGYFGQDSLQEVIDILSQDGRRVFDIGNDVESKVLASINIFDVVNELPLLESYLDILNNTYNYIAGSFTVNTESELFKRIETVTKDGVITNKIAFNGVINEMDRLFKGRYLDTMTAVEMGEETYNFSDVKRRFDFVVDSVEHIDKLRKKHWGNAFVRAFAHDAGSMGIPIYRFSDNLNKDDLEKSYYHTEFMRLDEADKEFFRIYQMLVYGFQYTTGSFYEMMDDQLERDYTKWLKEVGNDKILNDPKNLDEILARTSDLLSGRRNPAYSKEADAYGNFRTRMNIDGELTPLSTPYPTNFNSHSKQNTAYPHPVMSDFSYDQKLTEDGDIIKINGLNRIRKFSRPEATKYFTDIFNGDTALTPNGIVEVSFVSYRNVFVKKIADLNTSPKIKTKDSRVRTYGISGNVLNDFLGKIHAAFPNIKVKLVDNNNAERLGITGWMSDGMVNINTDLVQADTPFHEYSHIVLGILKVARYDTYFELLKMASTLVNNNNAVAVGIYNLYPDLDINDRLEEVVAGILGIQNAEMAISKHIGLFGNPGKAVGKSFWEQVKAIIERAWAEFKNLFKASYGVPLMDDNFNSIADFSNKVYNAINKGQVITSLSSTEFTHLVGSFSKDSRVGKVTNINGLLKHLDNPTNDPKFDAIHRNNLAASVINVIQAHKGKVPFYVYGTPIEFDDYETLKPTDKTVQEIVKNMVQEDSRKANQLITIIQSAFEPDGYFTSPDKQNFLNSEYGRKRNGRPVVTVSQFNAMLKAIDFNNKTKYMTINQYSKKRSLNLDIAGLENMNIMVAIENKSKDREIISLFSVTTQSPAGTYTGDGSVNVMSTFKVSDRKANDRGIGMKTSIMGKSSFAIGYLSSAISRADSNIKVRSAALLRPRFNKKVYYGIDIANTARELKAVVAFDEVKEFLSPEMIEIIGKTSAASFNWGVYLDNLNNEDDENTPFVSLSLNIQMQLLSRRMREITEKTTMREIISQEEEEELEMLSQYMAMLNNGQLTDNTVNAFPGKINRITRYIFDQNAIGERNYNIIRQIILNSSNRIVKESNEIKDRLAVVHKKAIELSGADITTRSVSNQSRNIWGALFDTITDSEGVDRRTGMIYWSNNLKDARNSTERELIKRAQLKGISQEYLDLGREYAKVIEDLMLENISHDKRMTELNVKENYSREELLEDLYANSSYSRGFIPMMGANVNELIAGGKFWAAVKKQKRQIIDMTVLMNEMPEYATMEKDQEYITRIKDVMFNQIGYKKVAATYTPFGAAERMNDFLGLRRVYDARGNIQWNTNDAIRNNNASYDIENILEYFTVSTKRVSIHEEYSLPVINAIKYGLTIRSAFKEIDNSTLIDHINDYVDAMVLGIRKDETEGARLGLVKIANFAELINAVARPIIMALNPNIAILSAASNFMLSFMEALSNSIGGTSLFGLKEWTAASAAFATDKKKASRVARYYQAINQTEYDLLHHYTTKTVDKNLISSFGSNYLNWYADNSGRTIIMIAQMMKDGSWEAHSIDKDGNVKYNPDKDKRFSNRKKDKKQQVLYDHIQTRAVAEGYDKGTRAYDFQEARKFKIISERKATGAFGAESRSVLNNYVLGRSAMMFSSWFVSRLSDAFSLDKTSKEGGRWIVEMIDGKEVPVWEEAFIEGYMTTIFKTIAKVTTFNFNELKRLSPDERKNLVKGMSTIGSWLLIAGLFNAVRALGDDDDDWKTAADIMKLRSIRNIMIASQGMVILPGLIEKFDSPFAGFSIINRGFISSYGNYSWKNLKHIIIFKRTYDFFNEPVELITDKDIWEHITE